mmetsp:Transcript_44186/g.99600  ORF Transcript_44186/g.99600 Transcript_44186/m.99600 type:complete len:125 (-) Transcript_44186:15-389(-)
MWGRTAEAPAAAGGDSSKAAFRGCVQAECVPLARQLAQLRSAVGVSAKFGMEHRGSTRAKQGLDPVRGDNALRQGELGRELQACEERCAHSHWPAAERAPWIGTVADEMAGFAADHTMGARGRL